MLYVTQPGEGLVYMTELGWSALLVVSCGACRRCFNQSGIVLKATAERFIS
jgi:hypothetical protein